MPTPIGAPTETDVLIAGGGTGGVAAALAACRAGRTVVLTEETDWIGGQLTSQAVPPDEHPWVEQFGVTDTYRSLRDSIRDHYRRWYPLRAEALDLPLLNPGAGRVSKLCHEPRVALAVMEAMIAPHVAAGRLTALTHTRPVADRAASGETGLGVTDHGVLPTRRDRRTDRAVDSSATTNGRKTDQRVGCRGTSPA